MESKQNLTLLTRKSFLKLLKKNNSNQNLVRNETKYFILESVRPGARSPVTLTFRNKKINSLIVPAPKSFMGYFRVRRVRYKKFFIRLQRYLNCSPKNLWKVFWRTKSSGRFNLNRRSLVDKWNQLGLLGSLSLEMQLLLTNRYTLHKWNREIRKLQFSNSIRQQVLKTLSLPKRVPSGPSLELKALSSWLPFLSQLELGTSGLTASTHTSRMFFRSKLLIARTPDYFRYPDVFSIPLSSNTWFFSWNQSLLTYNANLLVPKIQLYLKTFKARTSEADYQLRFRFNKNRLIVSLLNGETLQTNFHISVGLFLKYFQKKKSLRRSKSFKLLMMRFLRKMLIIINLSDLKLVLRGVPSNLNILLSSLLRPLPHLFKDPFTGQSINEITSVAKVLNFSSITFKSYKPFGYLKPKKRGRVKRKIRRKLFSTTRVID